MNTRVAACNRAMSLVECEQPGVVTPQAALTTTDLVGRSAMAISHSTSAARQLPLFRPYIGRAEDDFLRAVYAGCFEIDADGSIWRVGRMRLGSVRPCVRRRAENKAPQYLQVRVVLDGKRIHALAHRVVWAYFNGPIPDGAVINHKNGNKRDNRPENLEPVSPSENVSHAHSCGLIDQRGQRNPASRISDADVARMRLEYANGGITQQQLATRHGISFQAVSRIVRGSRRASNLGPTGDYTLRRRHKCRRDQVTGRYT